MLKRFGAAIRKFIGRLRGDRFDLSGDFRGATVNIKPITQRIMEIKPWAWLVGIALLALALLLFASIFNIGPIRSLLPTPTAFALAQDDESLIIVADFEDRSKGTRTGFDPAQRIFDQLRAQADKKGLPVRIERLYEPVTQNTARAAAEKYSAALILWGWYDVEGIQPTLERLRLRAERSSEESPDRQLTLAEPQTIEFKKILNTDLPARASYLAWFAFGLDAYNNGRDDQAQTYFNSALAAVPKGSEETTNPAEAYFFRGNIHINQRSYKEAIENYKEAIRIRPYDVGAYNNRGIAYDYMDDYADAIKDFDRAIELNPNYADAYLNRGVAYDHKGDLNTAIKDYGRAIELNQDDANAYYNRGLANMDQGNFDDAIKDFSRVIEIKKDFAVAFYQRGIAYAFKGGEHLDNAVGDFTHAVELEPNEASNYFGRGLVLMAKKEDEQAIRDFKKVLELSSDPDVRRQAEEYLKQLSAQ